MSPFVGIKEVVEGDMLRPVAEDMHRMAAERNPAVEVAAAAALRYRQS